MKKRREFILLIFSVLIVFAVSVALPTGGWAYKSQTSNLKSVRVEVAPGQLLPGQAATFKVQLSTHSVELSYDLVKLSTLKDDAGRQYQAVQWSGDPPGGHHRSGVLEFQAIAAGAKAVTLSIRDIAGVPERTFEWKLKP